MSEQTDAACMVPGCDQPPATLVSNDAVCTSPQYAERWVCRWHERNPFPEGEVEALAEVLRTAEIPDADARAVLRRVPEDRHEKHLRYLAGAILASDWLAAREAAAEARGAQAVLAAADYWGSDIGPAALRAARAAAAAAGGGGER